MVEWTWLLVLAILFCATFIRSAFGFGEALIAVPLLALVMPVETAAPIAVLASITIATMILAQDWRHVHFHSAKRLILSTLVGTPLGLVLLLAIPGAVIKIILAIVIFAFSGYSLFSRKAATLKDDRLAWPFGFCAGVLGGAYGTNGPPLVIYGILRGWSAQDFRATLQGYFFPASLMTAAGYWFAGLWTANVVHYYLIGVPVIVIAVFAGRVANQRLNSQIFLTLIHAGLALIGTALFLQALL